MEKLKQELDWLATEKTRLITRYVNEQSESRSKIIMCKINEVRSMIVHIKYDLSKLERGA